MAAKQSKTTEHASMDVDNKPSPTLANNTPNTGEAPPSPTLANNTPNTGEAPPSTTLPKNIPNTGEAPPSTTVPPSPSKPPHGKRKRVQGLTNAVKIIREYSSQIADVASQLKESDVTTLENIATIMQSSDVPPPEKQPKKTKSSSFETMWPGLIGKVSVAVNTPRTDDLVLKARVDGEDVPTFVRRLASQAQTSGWVHNAATFMIMVNILMKYENEENHEYGMLIKNISRQYSIATCKTYLPVLELIGDYPGLLFGSGIPSLHGHVKTIRRHLEEDKSLCDIFEFLPADYQDDWEVVMKREVQWVKGEEGEDDE